jgi:hypothetical protein
MQIFFNFKYSISNQTHYVHCKHSLFPNIQFQIEIVQLNANILYFQLFDLKLNLFNWMQTFSIFKYSILNRIVQLNANILYFQLFDLKSNLFSWMQTFFIFNYSILNRICSVECKHSLFSNIQFWIEFVQLNANILYFQLFDLKLNLLNWMQTFSIFKSIHKFSFQHFFILKRSFVAATITDVPGHSL